MFDVERVDVETDAEEPPLHAVAAKRRMAEQQPTRRLPRTTPTSGTLDDRMLPIVSSSVTVEMSMTPENCAFATGWFPVNVATDQFSSVVDSSDGARIAMKSGFDATESSMPALQRHSARSAARPPGWGRFVLTDLLNL